ncbi:hypothetical protein DPMN_048170 [Dreissena polymorpha]|uniref:Uncharacterized protein n=1 Tax=Dreissena polymorpha TaxID=45954 RepID=A0A9D4HZV9_DREPO|nr:hypothetical protein DPMN_048170 [Dreissena polymorpha]
MTKFHEDWTTSVNSRVLTSRDIIFHDDLSKYKTSRVLTGLYNSHMRKTAPPHGDHNSAEVSLEQMFLQGLMKINVTSRFLFSNIIGTNLRTKFHEDRTINVASRVLTRQNVDVGRRTKDDPKSSP